MLSRGKIDYTLEDELQHRDSVNHQGNVFYGVLRNGPITSKSTTPRKVHLEDMRLVESGNSNKET